MNLCKCGIAEIDCEYHKPEFTPIRIIGTCHIICRPPSQAWLDALKSQPVDYGRATREAHKIIEQMAQKDIDRMRADIVQSLLKTFGPPSKS